MPQAEVTARSLRLQWVPGNDGASPVRFFSLQLRELPAGTWHTYPASLGHDATSCQVERYGLGSALLSHPEGLPISSWASSSQAPPHTHTPWTCCILGCVPSHPTSCAFEPPMTLGTVTIVLRLRQ